MTVGIRFTAIRGRRAPRGNTGTPRSPAEALRRQSALVRALPGVPRSIAVAFVLAVGLLAASGATGWRDARQLLAASDEVSTTLAVLGRSAGVRAGLIDTELAHRGFILTGDDRFLEPMQGASTRLRADVAELLRLAGGIPGQQARVERLAGLVDARIVAIDRSIRLRRERPDDRSLHLALARGSRTDLDHQRALLDEIDRAESSMLAARRAAIEAKSRRATATYLVRYGLTILLLATTFGWLARENARRRRAEEEVQALNQDLASKVAELRDANGELEAFSYSVSHDLRSPLRSIDGFTRRLDKGYGPSLDEEGRRLLGVIRLAAQGMGELIDDLLAFSRAGRQSLSLQPVDMTALARTVVAELAPEGEGAEVAVEELPAAVGDPALLRLVWQNLIDNALKFSRRSPAPRVEITGVADAGGSRYIVRDNGAGFDMAYGDKLFGVFQRLHHRDEFEGTGVGLALVQRIVHRHGGKVAGEGRVGEGATFTFTLPLSHDLPERATAP